LLHGNAPTGEEQEHMKILWLFLEETTAYGGHGEISWSHPDKHMLPSFPFFRFILDSASEHPRYQSILFEADERHAIF